MKKVYVLIASLLLSAPARAVVPRINEASFQESIAINPQLPDIPARKFVITSFGAVGDGKHSNTDAFRKAIASCRENGGGQVVVPAGTFLTGPIELTSNMALVLEKGATIRGSETATSIRRRQSHFLFFVGGPLK